MRMIAIAFTATLLAACAAQPAGPVPPAPVAVTAGSTAVAPATSTTAAPVEAGSAKTRIPSGYKLVERDGTRLLCTRTTTLGSRFPKEICMTEAEYVELERSNEGSRQDLRKGIGICGGGTGVGSCSGG